MWQPVKQPTVEAPGGSKNGNFRILFGVNETINIYLSASGEYKSIRQQSCQSSDTYK